MHVFLQCMHTTSTRASSQSAEKERALVHLQGKLQESDTKMTQLDGECLNGTLLKTKERMTG